MSSLGDFDDFDHLGHNNERTTPNPSLGIHDGSGIATSNPKDIQILLPSSIELKVCLSHHAKSLAVKESKLWYTQANNAIHRMLRFHQTMDRITCESVDRRDGSGRGR